MRAGYLSTNCGSCHKQEPEVREALGCIPHIAANQPAWKLYEEDRVVNYMNCPNMFVPKWAWHFWEVYKGYQNNRYAIPSFFDQSRKYVLACDIFESALNHFQILKARDDEAAAQRNRLSSRFG